MYNTMSRNSYDNAGRVAEIYVRDENALNAYYVDKDDRFQMDKVTNMYFGDGDNVKYKPKCVLDIMAHEYGHAITDFTSDLLYLNQAGALNESFSDIFACIIEYEFQYNDTEEDNANISSPFSLPGKFDYLIGEDSIIGYAGLRDLKNPGRADDIYGSGAQPKYYLGKNWYSGYEDNGGVHINSGVQNFVFYLLVCTPKTVMTKNTCFRRIAL